jgi:hypothetical protein
MQNFFLNTDVGGVKDRIRAFAKANYTKPHLRSLADAAGISYQNLVTYDDDSLPSGPILMKLRETGLSIDWLLTGEGEMRAADRTPVEVFPLRRERGVPSPLERLRDARELIDKAMRDVERNEGRESGDE